MTEEEIGKVLTDVHADSVNKIKYTEYREIVIHTGPEGQKQIEEAIEVESWLYILKSQLHDGKVKLEEYNSLKTMIVSPDKENLILAQEIIKAKDPNTWQSNSQHLIINTQAQILTSKLTGLVSPVSSNSSKNPLIKKESQQLFQKSDLQNGMDSILKKSLGYGMPKAKEL